MDSVLREDLFDTTGTRWQVPSELSRTSPPTRATFQSLIMVPLAERATRAEPVHPSVSIQQPQLPTGLPHHETQRPWGRHSGHLATGMRCVP
jgi:hypothetical protein